MINPSDVNLIIFDMDGTILSSLKPVYEALRRTFAKQGWEVPFGEKDIEKYFGMAGGELYHFITPAGESWQDVRTKAREEYSIAFRESAHLFPGVRETLGTLRERGYRLALYTNSSTEYLSMVDSVLGIRDLFDYMECAGENDLTKTELVRKIRGKFDGLEAAVVGDRVHDIEAAGETGSLSIGVQFGYGGSEPERADITIDRFEGLLAIFDRRLLVFEKILNEIDGRKAKNRPFVVGITGNDSAGKTMFAGALADFLASKNRKVRTISLDDFHNPRHVRYSGENQAENYYRRSFNIKSIVEDLMIPIREKGEYSVTLTLLDLHTDRYEIEKEFSFERDTIVLFEGVFLFRKELSPYIDYKIFLDITFQESRRRAGERDVPIYGENILQRYDEKYLPAQMKYLEEYPPQEAADMIIDNASWEYPVIVRQGR